MIESIIEFLQSNDIASGGLAIALGASLLYYLRSVPTKIFNVASKRLIETVEIHDDDPAFAWLVMFLQKQNNSFLFRPKDSTLVTAQDNRSVTRRIASNSHDVSLPDDDEDETQSSRRTLKFYFFPAPGIHLFRYNGRWMWFHRERKEEGGESGGNFNFYKKEKVILRTLSKDQSIFNKLMEEARDNAIPPNLHRVRIYRNRYIDDWTMMSMLPPRSLNTIVLPPNVKEGILQDAKSFINSREWYTHRGVPYRRGYLLYGPPGNGKSSLIHGLASELERDIGTISLKDSRMSDSTISMLLSTPETRHMIVVFEDIDCVFSNRQTGENNENNNEVKTSVTLSGMLNAIDGIGSAEGRIIIMTTNHPEKLDSALIRPGRVDMKVYLGNASSEQISQMYARFFDKDTADRECKDFADLWPDEQVSMAAIQGYLQRHVDEPQNAFDYESICQYIKEQDVESQEPVTA